MRWISLAAVVLAAALVPAGHVRGQTPDMSVPALLSHGPTSELVRLDARTLAVQRGRIFVGRHDFPWSRSPDGSRAVLGSGRAPGLRFVGLRPLRLGRSVAVEGFVTALAWVAPSRVLVVVARRCCPAPLRALVVDAAAFRILSNRVIGRGAVLAAARTGRGLALLVGGEGRIGPARLVVLDARGRPRSRELLAIRAGSKQLRPRLIEHYTPGLAVDRRAGHAYVVGWPKLVADVDLRSLAVEYHRLASREAQASADGGTAIGETRHALWLDGRLLITGYDDRVERGNATSDPAGLTLVDPRNWRARILDPTVRSASRVGRLVVGWAGNDALVAFDADGGERLRIVNTPAGGGLQVRWPYAYRGLEDGYRPHRADVVDLRTGRLTRARVPGWIALLGDEERLCWC